MTAAADLPIGSLVIGRSLAGRDVHYTKTSPTTWTSRSNVGEGLHFDWLIDEALQGGARVVRIGKGGWQ